jgi:hypothetical protein
MPTPYIKKLSREDKGSVPALEKKWDEAKEAAGKQGHSKDYGYVTNIFKKMSHASLRLQAKSRLLASAGNKIFDVLISYDDPRNDGSQATAHVKIPNCEDAAQAKRVFKKEKAHKYPNFKITRVTEMGPPTMNP